MKHLLLLTTLALSLNSNAQEQEENLWDMEERLIQTCYASLGPSSSSDQRLTCIRAARAQVEAEKARRSRTYEQAEAITVRDWLRSIVVSDIPVNEVQWRAFDRVQAELSANQNPNNIYRRATIHRPTGWGPGLVCANACDRETKRMPFVYTETFDAPEKQNSGPLGPGVLYTITVKVTGYLMVNNVNELSDFNMNTSDVRGLFIENTTVETQHRTGPPGGSSSAGGGGPN